MPLAWGTEALGTATGVTQRYWEPGCFGRGGCRPSTPQMGPFPSPAQPSEPHCVVPVPAPGAGRALPGAVLARSLSWARGLGLSGAQLCSATPG